MYVEYSARVFKKYRSHNVSHTAQVYNVLYTYCGGCAGFQSKDSLHSLYSLYIYIDCVDYITKSIYIYIYRFCWLKLLRMYQHSFARRVQKMYARGCARKSQF